MAGDFSRWESYDRIKLNILNYWGVASESTSFKKNNIVLFGKKDVSPWGSHPGQPGQGLYTQY